MQTAVCSSCGDEKPRTSKFFIPNPQCRNGLTRTCRVCRRAYLTRWRATPEQKKQRQDYHRRTYVPVDVAVKIRARAARKPYRDRAKVLRAGILIRSKQCRVPIDKDLFTTSYLMKWLRQQPCCECCGVELAVKRRFIGRKLGNSPSLDRVIPSRGYVRGNVALLCWRCNNLKRDATEAELFRVASWLRNRLHSETKYITTDDRRDRWRLDSVRSWRSSSTPGLF